MPRSRVVGALTATVIALAAASATGLSQAPAPDAGPRGTAGAGSMERVTVTGCVLHEAVYARSTAAPAVVRTARDAQAEFVIIVDTDRRQVFSVTGPQEGTFAAYVGRRVEAVGTLEQAPLVRVAPSDQTARDGSSGTPGPGHPGAGLPPPGAAGVTPSGSPAHEPSDALPETVPPSVRSGDAPSGQAHDADVLDVYALPRLNVVSVRSADGDCERLSGEPPRQGTPAAARLPSPDPAPAVNGPASAARAADAGPIDAVGCLVRWTPTGAALTPGPGDLALTQALVTEPAHQDRTSAVPGSQPSGRDSGTVPARPARSGRSDPSSAGERAFLLETSAMADIERLTGHIGERVAIVGVPLDPADAAASGADRAQPDADAAAPGSARAANAGSRAAARAANGPAHQTAPMERLRVTAFRHVGGHCF